MSPKVTVITPTIRQAGLELVSQALKRQTLGSSEFEWIVCSLASPTIKGLPFKFVRDPGKNDGDVWSLNKAYNAALRQAKGELIVSWQDYTFAQPDALQRFWGHYKSDPKMIVSGVGDKYESDDWLIPIWMDPRPKDYHNCPFNDIEGNFCAVPKQAFYSVGGFDEHMDTAYGMDFFSVLDRLDLQGGWKFYIDNIQSFSLSHDRPKDWDEQNWIGEPYRKYRERYLEKEKLDYLQ